MTQPSADFEIVAIIIVVVLLVTLLIWGMTRPNSEEYEEGYAAGLKRNHTNPYVNGTDEHMDWKLGNEEAYIDLQPLV